MAKLLSSREVAAVLRYHSPSACVRPSSATAYAMMNLSCSPNASNSSCCGKSSSAMSPPWNARTSGSSVPASELGTDNRNNRSTPFTATIVLDCVRDCVGNEHGLSTTTSSSPSSAGRSTVGVVVMQPASGRVNINKTASNGRMFHTMALPRSAFITNCRAATPILSLFAMEHGQVYRYAFRTGFSSRWKKE